MPLYVHTCLSHMSGIAMMVNCIISCVVGLWGSGADGSAVTDKELAQCPFIYKYFRIIMLTGSIMFNIGRFVFESMRGDVMLILILFRFFGSVVQLLEHLYLCKNYEQYISKLEMESYYWTRAMFSLAVFCGLGIFSGLAGENGYGKSAIEHIFWSLALFMIMLCGLLWGRYQTDGLCRSKYLACRGSCGICVLATIILVVVAPKADGVVNRVVIGLLFFVATLLFHFMHRRDMRDLATINATALKELSSPQNSPVLFRRLSQLSMMHLVRSSSKSMVAVAAPPSEKKSPEEEGVNLQISDLEAGGTQHLTVRCDTQDSSECPSVAAPGIIVGPQAITAGEETMVVAPDLRNDKPTPLSEHHHTRRSSYQSVSDARRARLINDIYLTKVVAIISQVVGWYCFIFVVELCVVAYFITNFGEPPIICPSFSPLALPLLQVVVDAIF